MKIPEPLLHEFSRFVEGRTGLCLPQSRHVELSRGITALAAELHCNDAETCVRRLMAMPLTQDLVGMLARHFTTGETYFFRDPPVFHALEYDILPPLIAARRRAGDKRLRIWSAGCCSGEEAYSLAIVLSRLIPDIADWRITLLGTDINPHFLDKARRGLYRDWSFRQLPESIKRGYFDMGEPGSHAIAARIKQLVSFSYLNLADDTGLAADSNIAEMDLVLCRNVLMYFDPTRAAQVIRRLHAALADGGWLIVSPAEASRDLFPQFAEVHFADARLYRKEGAARAVPAVPAPPQTPAMRAAGDRRDAATVGNQTDASSGMRALAMLARSHANNGELDEAFHCCEAAIAADKANPELRYLRAMILQEQDQLDAAIQSLKQALFLDSGFVLAYFALGSLYRRCGKLAEAARHFSNAATLLGKYAPGATLPESGGITAARLSAIIRATEGVA